MWYFFKGLQSEHRKFPYKATCPSDRKTRVFDGITCVYDELIALYDEAVESNAAKGHSLYIQHFYFTSDVTHYNLRDQSTIKGMRFCDQTRTPPFPSLKQTPFNYISKYNWYTDELHHITELERKKNANN